MRRHTLALVLITIALVTSACTSGIEQVADVLASPSATSTVSISPTRTPIAPSSPAEAPIVVRTPRPGDDVLSPIVVSGSAISATGEILIDVLDAEGMELAAMSVRIDCGASCRGRFRARLAFYVPTSQSGTVEVSEVGSGGSTEHLVEVDVTLVPGV